MNKCGDRSPQNARAQVYERALMLPRGYIFQKSEDVGQTRLVSPNYSPKCPFKTQPLHMLWIA
jgi:hypothetical protein